MPVQVVYNPGDFTTPASTIVDPNPVVAELKPAGPPVRAKPKRPKPKPATTAAAPPPSPFPNPPTR